VWMSLSDNMDPT